MDKREALAIFTRAFVRELLRDDDPPAVAFDARPRPDDEPPTMATPLFDFEEPADPVPSDVELDEAVAGGSGGTAAERAARRRAIFEARARERLFPEDLPMSGMAPPEDLP